MSTYVIAEAGVNHNGSIERARALVQAAAEAGADAVKFQAFRAEALVAEGAPKAEYQEATTDPAESQAEMLRKLELGQEQHQALAEHCADRGIQFLSTPFDAQSARWLAEEIEVPRLKVGSGELTNGPFLLHVARLGCPTVLSTGMATIGEVERALSVLAFGYLEAEGRPTREALGRALASDAGQEALEENVTVLHCVTEYPAPPEATNLRALKTLRQAFGLPVGLSDHTLGTAVPVAAVARGAVLIEKHLTLDRSLPGPDHEASLEPGELRRMIQDIREVEKALGTARKAPAAPEWKNRPVARKSLVAAEPIAEGEPFTEENVTAKRPGDGLSPMRYWDVLGRPAPQSYRPDEQIRL